MNKIQNETTVKFINALIDKTKSSVYEWFRGIKEISDYHNIPNICDEEIIDELSFSCCPSDNSIISVGKTEKDNIFLIFNYDFNVPTVILAPSKDAEINKLSARLYQIVYESLPNVENFMEWVIGEQ